jgi:hypothetical protein
MPTPYELDTLRRQVLGLRPEPAARLDSLYWISNEFYGALRHLPRDVGGRRDAPVAYVDKEEADWELRTHVLCEVLAWRRMWTRSANNRYPAVVATPRSADPAPPEPDRTPAPWEANIQATCECLSWRGTLDNLERGRAEDTLGQTAYADFPVHTRAPVVTAPSLLERGEISEHELENKMNEVRARFQQA